MRNRPSIASLALALASSAASGQEGREPTGIVAQAPPFSLTLDQLYAWTPDGPLAGRRNRSSVALAPRFVDPQGHGDPRARVMIAPDGMNDLGNYVTAQPRFNLYNFRHWGQVDILVWFAGTAERTVNLPARPWVDAAHRNGVKVIGTVFLAPVAWGGSPETVGRLLRRRADGSFPAADQLVAIARHYGFDGWLINQETAVDAVAARATMAFMAYLKRVAPPPLETHWYDAMLPDGSVGWQNALTARNAAMLQDGATARADGVFLNYQWTPAGLRESATRAEAMGRSRYDLFVGADLWPARDNAPAAFRNSHWLADMTDPATGRAYGSIALFAPNFSYNWPGDARTPRFSDFDRDPADVGRYYAAEARLFGGDGAGWPGIAAQIPARSTITALPFATSFNTGHGRRDVVDGRAVGGAWSDMARQDVLPSWPFTPGAITARYDFDRVWRGGSALHVVGSGSGAVPLYLTRIAPGGAMRLRVTSFAARRRGAALTLTFADATTRRFPLPAVGAWATRSWCIARPRAAMTSIGVATVTRTTDATIGAIAIMNGC